MYTNVLSKARFTWFTTKWVLVMTYLRHDLSDWFRTWFLTGLGSHDDAHLWGLTQDAMIKPWRKHPASPITTSAGDQICRFCSRYWWRFWLRDRKRYSGYLRFIRTSGSEAQSLESKDLVVPQLNREQNQEAGLKLTGVLIKEQLKEGVEREEKKRGRGGERWRENKREKREGEREEKRGKEREGEKNRKKEIKREKGRKRK